jgi:arsenite methyltransferase
MKRPDYGIDAPGLVWTFFGLGCTALTVLLTSLFSTSFIAFIGTTLTALLVIVFGLATLYLLGMGCFMIYGSKVMKLNDSEALLNRHAWSGQERVLDVGCGRGLLLVGAAKRLTTGTAVGMDVWSEKDQARNHPTAALANAEMEGVAARVGVVTADMRHMPFPDDQFDVVVSNWTIHNAELPADRQATLNEIIRVLKPGGTVLIIDIVFQADYATHLSSRGMIHVQQHPHGLRDTVLKSVSFGSFAPSPVTAQKPA